MTSLIENAEPTALPEIAEEVGSGNRVASQRHRCLLEVWKRPGRTAAEVARAAGLRRHAPSRRLPDLRRCGLVRNGHRRTCAVTGHPGMTWFPCTEKNNDS